MNILFTICGRAGSKGVKNKNSKEFLDYPLSFYTTSIIDLFMRNNPQHQCDLVLNTDSTELISLFKDHLKIPFEIVDRAEELAGDLVPKIHVIKDSYEVARDRKKKDYDMVVDLDITSPLRTLNDLEALIEKKLESNADIVFSVTDSRRNPYFNMVMKTDHGYERVITSNFNTRQETPEIFDMNASMYAYSPSFLIQGKGIFDGKCDVIKMMDTAILDIDSESDFKMMEIIANHLFQHYPGHKAIRDNIFSIMN